MKKVILLFGVIAALLMGSCEKSDTDTPTNTPRTDVPVEIAGTWQHGSIDFDLWENYREGYYAGRYATPMREAMVFSSNGDAKYYRYEFARNMYEELIDCTGTVTFNSDGTFTFYPVKGRKRFYDSNHSQNNTVRNLSGDDLLNPKIAGKRGYTYNDGNPPSLRITVPGSAPYNWYKIQ